MAWYDEAVFYHIYPLGLTGAPRLNPYGDPVHRLQEIIPWIRHIKELGCNALYIGPLFESVGHGYETTDYRKLDSRLGTNEDLREFVALCHDQGIHVILDGVFNHTGRDFFAFQDLKEKREASPYKDWYVNVNFYGNNEYNDGFSYDNWGGYNLLVKLNQRNPAVRDYICDVIRFWVAEFDIDGIRLDAADVLDFDFMKALRHTANEVKPEFWLMGEVIHGDYGRWVNQETLHCVTNYMLHKGLYSGLNDHNFFEIAHTVRYVRNMTGDMKLYQFLDNHDVERISTKLQIKAQFTPAHIMLYTLPGIPSLYYGSEFGIGGKKERNSDDSLRPQLDLDLLLNGKSNPWTVPGLDASACVNLIRRLGKVRAQTKALSCGDYTELQLTTRQFAYARRAGASYAVIMVNNDEQQAASISVSCDDGEYTGTLFGETITVRGGRMEAVIGPCSGEIWVKAVCEGETEVTVEPALTAVAADIPADRSPVNGDEGDEEKAGDVRDHELKEAEEADIPDIPYEDMTVEQLQASILAKMRRNGPVTAQMRSEVEQNVWKGSLINWVKSFR